MRVLLVTPYYGADSGPSAPLLTMLCEDLASAGYDIEVVAAVPHYPSGNVKGENLRRPWRWNFEGKIRVCRVWVPSGNRSNLFHRSVVFLCYQVLSALAGLTCRYDALFITNPALETFLPFILLGWFRRRPVLYAVWDLYPEAGIQSGIFRPAWIAKIVGWLEQICLRRAAAIQIISPGFNEPLIRRGIVPEKIALILPWVDPGFFQPLPRRNRFSDEHGLNYRFVALYAGNLGFTHDLETLVGSVRYLSAQPDIMVLIVGEGPQQEQVDRLAAEQDSHRLVCLPFQPRPRLPELLAAADVALVSQKDGSESSSLPSKLFNHLASGRPVIAVAGSGTPLCKILLESGAGFCVPPGDPAALAQAVLELHKDADKRKAMGRAGSDFARAHCSRQAAAEKFSQLLESLQQW